MNKIFKVYLVLVVVMFLCNFGFYFLDNNEVSENDPLISFAGGLLLGTIFYTIAFFGCRKLYKIKGVPFPTRTKIIFMIPACILGVGYLMLTAGMLFRLFMPA